MFNKKIYSDEQKQEMLNLYQSGLGIVQIGKEMHIAPMKIKEILIELGIDAKKIERKNYPNGYWNDYSHVEEAFKQCQTKKELSEKFLGAFNGAVRNGWYNELSKKYLSSSSKNDDGDSLYALCAYEIEEYHSVFVGKSTDMKNYDYFHRNYSNNSNLSRFCFEHQIEAPQPKIIKENISLDDCKNEMDELIREYADKGWNILNKNSNSDDIRILSGKDVKWDYDTCKDAAKACKSKSEFKKRFGRAYQVSVDNKWIDEFIPELVKNEAGCFDSLEECKKAALDYKSIMDIRNNYPFLYRKISQNKWIEEVRQAINEHNKKSEDKDKTQVFIEKAKKIHGDKYDYSKTVYINGDQAVCIICPKHGEFWQKPRVHLRGRGCRQCWIDSASKKRADTVEEFIEKAREIHEGKYDYSKVVYKNAGTKVTIICPTHGEFEQTPNSHLSGNGCIFCGRIASGEKLRLTQEEFVKKAKACHKTDYDYSKSIFNGTRKPVTIICPKHGEFTQVVSNHLQGYGCPKCGNIVSTAEYDLRDYIESLIGKDKVIMHDKMLMRNGKELDLVVPDYKLAIEYDGLVWHSEKYGTDRYYHLNKTEACEKLGYRLLHIYEDEWQDHKEIILAKIRHILGRDIATPCIGARKCVISEINKDLAKVILDKYHIQGYAPATVYLGASYNGELVGVMTFKIEKDSRWELTRFVTVDRYRLPGLANKLFKYFVEHYNPEYIKSFLDRRWNHTGNTVYEKLGFEIEEVEKPDYYYVVDNGHNRAHKFKYRKQILSRKYGFPLTMTEREMTEELGLSKIWNCGLVKYAWNKKEASEK